MKQIRLIGLALFLIGLTVFTFSITLGEFKLTDEVLSQTMKPEHLEALKPGLQPIMDKVYSSNIDFIADFNQYYDAALEKNNAEAKKNKEWGKVIYDKYTFNITKNSSIGVFVDNQWLFFLLSLGLGIIGALMYVIPKVQTGGPAGIKNDGIFHKAATSRGWVGIIAGTWLIAFYILLYFNAEYITNWVLLVDPLSRALSGKPASEWFLYGVLYCVAMSVMGTRMYIKYRHSKYQIIRTTSVLFFQLGIAFLLPEILVRLNQPYYDFKNMWPLDYDFFDAWHIDMLTTSGGIGIFMLAWGLTLFIIGVPTMVYFFGKRWYCSWVCGCGGLAETLGDPYRQLSDKSLNAWKIERWMIHSVLVFSVVMTAGMIYTYFFNNHSAAVLVEVASYKLTTADLRSGYGFMIGSIFSGVVGTGFYPLMGNRVWCRFGCPLAAYLGLVQRFQSRFRITTNGGQCISCGNCSTYCEMGIDVRAYAQKGQNIVRSSCVGCGVCSAVCPRGVLNLENADGTSLENRTELPAIIIGRDKIEVAS